jgi:hypothetical protein
MARRVWPWKKSLARDRRQQILEVRIPPPAPAHRNQVSKRFRPRLTPQLLRPLEHRAIEALDVRRQLGDAVEQDAHHPLVPRQAGVQPVAPREVVLVQQVQLLQRQLQPQRIARRRRAIRQPFVQQRLHDLRVDLPVIPAAD